MFAMPRILPADHCPKCQGPLKRSPSLLGALFTCDRCDADDPLEGAQRWINSELRGPRSPNNADR
jgi:hypothetical protein